MRKIIAFLFIAALSLGSIMLGGCTFGSYESIEILSIGRAVRPGDVVMYTALGVNSDGETRVVKATWVLSGTAGVLINSDGPTADVLAVMPGKGTLTATKGKAKGSIEIDVYLPVLSGISITPSECKVPKNSSASFSAAGYDQHKRPVPCNPEWSVVGAIGTLSSDSGTMVTLKTPGIGAEGKLIARQGEVVAEAAVEVYPLPSVLTSIVVQPGKEDMYIGETAEYRAYALDQYQELMPETDFTWRVEGAIGSCSTVSGASTDFSAAALGSGSLVASLNGLEGSAQITVAEKITISGTVKDCETEELLHGVEVRVYKNDFKDGICTDTTFSDESGSWTFDLPKLNFSYVILQAHTEGYYFRTAAFPNVSNTSLQIALMPDNLPGFSSFMDETTNERLTVLSQTLFKGFKILMTDPSGQGTFSLEQAQYLESLFQDDATAINEFLGMESFPVNIVAGDYTPDYYEIAIVPDASLLSGTSVASFNTHGNYTRIGGIIRLSANNVTEWSLKRMLLHGLAHILYLVDTTERESILNTEYGEYNVLMPLDMKGATIASDPAFRIVYWDLSEPDYIDRILGTRFGIGHLASF